VRGTLLPAALPSRIRGRQSLTRRLRALLVSAVRFDRGRAQTPDDRRFSAALIDGLTATLATLDGPGVPPKLETHTSGTALEDFRRSRVPRSDFGEVGQ
jgi:hypothetical protein